jgi:multidrug resistance efflux pump
MLNLSRRIKRRLPYCEVRSMSSIPVSTVDTRDLRPELPAPPLRIAVFAGLALISGIAAAWGLTRSSTPTLTGRIEARTTCVTAQRTGIVIELLAREGDRVTLGDPLISLVDGELQAEIARMQSEITTRTSELQQAQALANVDLAWRIKELDTDIADVQLRAADYLKEKFNHELERSMWNDVLAEHETVMFDQGDAVFKSIVLKSRLPSEQRLNVALRAETASNAVEVSAAQVQICDQRLATLQQLKLDLPQQIRDKAGVGVAEQRLAESQAELERLRARETQLTIESPAVGTVGVFRRRPGDQLRPGDPIVELLDDAQRWLVIDVPSTQITRFEPDVKLIVTFPGNQTREGRVVHIAPQARPVTQGADAVVSVRAEQSGRLWPTVPIRSQVEVRLAE